MTRALRGRGLGDRPPLGTQDPAAAKGRVAPLRGFRPLDASGRSAAGRMPSRGRVGWLLARAHGRMLFNAVWRSGPGPRWWAGASLGAAVVAGAIAFSASRIALQSGHVSEAALEAGATGAMSMVSGFALVTGIGFALGSLYAAPDVESLLATPAPAGGILLGRTATQLATGGAIGGLLAAPVVVAGLLPLGRLWAIPLVGTAVLALASLSLSLGMAMAVALVRIVPADRARSLAGGVAILAIAVVAVVDLLVRGPEGFAGGTARLLDPTQHAGPADLPWLPTGWAGRSIVGAARGRVAEALAWLAPLAVVGVGAPWLLARCGERAYLAGWERSQVGRRRRAPSAGSWRALAGGSARPGWYAVAAKDLRELRRDPALLAQLLLPLALFAAYVSEVAAPSSHLDPTAGSRLPRWFHLALTAAFASLFTASGVALRGVGAEGRRLWLVRSAPLGVGSLVAAKLAVGAMLAAGMALPLFWIGEGRAGAPLPEVALGSVRLLVVVAALAALATGLGSLRPRLDWRDPRRAVGLWLSLAYLACGGVFIGVCFLVLAAPYVVEAPGWSAIAGADLVLLLLAVGAGGGVLAAGIASLQRLEL